MSGGGPSRLQSARLVAAVAELGSLDDSAPAVTKVIWIGRLVAMLCGSLIALASLSDAFAAPGEFATHSAVYQFDAAEGSVLHNGLGRFVGERLLFAFVFGAAAVILVKSLRARKAGGLRVRGANVLAVALFLCAVSGYVRWWQSGFDH